MVLIPRAERGLPFLPRPPSSAQSSPADASMPWARSDSQALTPVPLSQLVQGQPFSPTQAGEGLAVSRARELCFTRACVSLKSCRLTAPARILRASGSPPQPFSAPLPPSGCPQVSPRPNLPRGQSAGCSQPEVHQKVSDNTAEAPELPTLPNQPRPPGPVTFTTTPFADEGTEAQS